MKMKKNIIAAAVMVAAMGMVATPAMAKFAAVTSAKVSSDLSAAKKAVGVAGVNATWTGVALDVVNNSSAANRITLELTAGALWKTAPSITTLATNGLTLNGITTGTIAPAAAGAVGTAVATWSSANAGTGVGIGTVLLTMNGATQIDLSAATGNVDAILKFWSGAVLLGQAQVGVDVTTAPGKPVIALIDSFAGNNVNTAASATADVATGFKKFTTASATSVTTDTAGVSLANLASAAPNASASVLIKLTGSMAGIASIVTASTAAPAAPGGFTSLGSSNATGGAVKADGTAGAAAAGTFFVDHANNVAYATAVIPTGVALTDIVPIIVLDGATVQTARTLSVSADLLGDANFAARAGILPAASAFTITRNGTSFSLNVMLGTDQLVLTNNTATGGTPGVLTISAVDAAGAAITAVAGATALPTALAPTTTTVINGSTILANFPGATKITVNVESASVDTTLIHVVPGVGASTTVITSGGGAVL